MKNRKHCERRRIKWFGNFSVLEDFLEKKPWQSPWGIIKLLSSLFRGFGAMAFSPSPLTGIVVFCAMLVGNPYNAAAGILTGVIAILTCKLINAPDEGVRHGVSLFNSTLLGCTMTSLIPGILGVQLNWQYWVVISIGAFITVLIEQGLQEMMAPSRLPVVAIPFCIVATIIFLIFRAQTNGFKLEENDFEQNYNATVEWNQVLVGAIRAPGHVYGVTDILPCILIWLGFLLYSPLLSMTFFSGSYIGAILAVFYNVQPLEAIYTGDWSFNSLLASGGIIFCLVPTPLSFLISIVTGIIAVSLQAAIAPIFMQTMVPVLAYPFCVAFMFILAISLRKESPLKHVDNKTFPEEHLLNHYRPKLFSGNEVKCDLKNGKEELDLTA